MVRYIILTEQTVTKNRDDSSCYEINSLGAKTSRVLVALLATLILFLLGGCTTSPKFNSQAMLHETGCGSMPLDASKTMHIVQMTENTGVRQISDGDFERNPAVGSRRKLALDRREARRNFLPSPLVYE